MRHIFDKFQFYVKALLCFLLIVTVFLSAFAYVYFRTTRQLKDDAINRTLTSMSHGAGEINDNFLRYYNTYQKVLLMSELQVLAHRDSNSLQPSDYSQLIKLQRRLIEIWTFNEYISDIMLVFDAANPYAVATKYTLDDLRSNYENRLFCCTEYGFADFMALIRNSANNSVTMNKFTPALHFTSLRPTEVNTPQGEKFLFAYQLSIPNQNYDVYAVMFLDAAGFRTKLMNGGNGAFAVTNGTDVLLAAGLTGADRQTITQQLQQTYYDPATRRTFLRVPSGSIALAYQTIISDSDIVRQISSFSSLLYLLLIVFIGICSLVLILVAIYVVKPLQKLFNRFYDSYIKTPRMRGKAFAHIDHEISLISSDNIQINSQLTNWEPLVRINLLGRLLRGEVLSEQEKRMMLKFLNLTDDQDIWQVAIIGRIVGLRTAQPEPPAEDFSQTVWCYLDEAVICRLRDSYYAVITRGRPAGEDTLKAHWNCETLYQRILEQLNQEGPGSYAIGIGTCRTALFDLHQSFKEAERAFREADIWKHPEVVLYQSLRQNSLAFSLPYQEIEKLYNLLVSGNAGQAAALLDTIAARVARESSQNRQYYHICKQFYYEVLGVLLRVSSQKDLSPILNGLLDYDDNSSLEDMVLRFRQAFELTTEAIRSSGSHISAHVLFLDMQKYIRDNFNRNDLSLKLLSQVFSLSEPYLSICFKNESGLNFSTFLESLRLAEAEKMLLESRLPVKDIAQHVGYSTPNTFFKAFKRKHGITPSAWLEIQPIQPTTREA